MLLSEIHLPITTGAIRSKRNITAYLSKTIALVHSTHIFIYKKEIYIVSPQTIYHVNDYITFGISVQILNNSSAHLQMDPGILSKRRGVSREEGTFTMVHFLTIVVERLVYFESFLRLFRGVTE